MKQLKTMHQHLIAHTVIKLKRESDEELKKLFTNRYKFCEGDFYGFGFILRNGVYP